MSTSSSRERSSSAKGKPRPRADRPKKANRDEEILALATGGMLEAGAVSRRLAALRRAHGDEVYARFIHMVSHLELSPEEARAHWEAIARHARDLTRKLRRSVDFRVGLADYFVHMAPRIRNPKVIEIHLFQETQAGTLKDGLTGLYNFRFFEEALTREMGQARRLGNPLGLCFVDVDHFKLYNDRLGHAAGNEALVAVAGVLRRTVRDMDLACRYGGEEFAVLLPATDRAGSLRVARRIVEGVRDLGMPHPGASGLLTVSAGVAAVPEDAQEAEALVQGADSAMYRAKAEGRNRAIAYAPERRRHSRHEARFGGTVALDGGERYLPFRGSDLSQGGLYLVLPEALPAGKSLDLVLEFGELGISQRVNCKARVARCQESGRGDYGVGVAFTAVPPADRLRLFQALSQAQLSRTPSR